MLLLTGQDYKKGTPAIKHVAKNIDKKKKGAGRALNPAPAAAARAARKQGAQGRKAAPGGRLQTNGPAGPRLAAQLPGSDMQNVEPLKKRPPAVVSVPLIRPQASAEAAPLRVPVDVASIEQSARRWGVHQQSLREVRSDIDAKSPPLLKGEETGKGPKPKAGSRGGKAKPASVSAGPIVPTMYITEIAEKYPTTLEILMEAGLHCIGCQLSAYDTLETGCALHGMGPDEVAELVRRMNLKLADEREKK
ncbi:Uncharacterised protein [uncultured archaeon]|nr:Uncharacterised protein [uncultured archaeon]